MDLEARPISSLVEGTLLEPCMLSDMLINNYCVVYARAIVMGAP